MIRERRDGNGGTITSIRTFRCSVDLHFRFWDPETEGFDAPGVDEFPSRMCSRRLGQLEGFHALHAVDTLGYPLPSVLLPRRLAPAWSCARLDWPVSGNAQRK